MITIHHESWVATLGISFPEIKNQIFSFGKKSFLGGNANMIISLHREGTAKGLQYYIGGVCSNDYNITDRGGRGLSGPPKVIT